MQSLRLNLINQKWLICSLLSFLGFMSLSFYLTPSQNPLSRQSSLQILEPSTNLAPTPQISPFPSIELPPSSSVVREEVYLAPELSPQRTSVGFKEENCDFYNGRWIYDPKAYPLYHGKQCPFLSEQVTCQKNGRPDSGYENWRWEAKDCEIPRFNGTYMLEKLRGKRVVIIGDSLNRNQWESLACLLYSSIHPSRAIVKMRRSVRVFRAKDYDCSVEFFWSPFLVRLDETKNGSKIIKLDKLSESARQWQGADVMVFNTGYWWTHHGRKKPWNYFEYRGKLMDMKPYTAFKIAMTTWARWIELRVDPAITNVFFRSISPVHKNDLHFSRGHPSRNCSCLSMFNCGVSIETTIKIIPKDACEGKGRSITLVCLSRMNLQWCFNQIQPMINNETNYVQWFPRPMVSTVEKTIQDMKTPVRYLNITELSQYRRDAHTSIYTTRKWKLLTKDQRKDPDEYADCDHWCLPGLPDTWNVLVYASIIETPSMLLRF